MTGAAASLDAQTGVVSAAFTVRAPSALGAAELGVTAFRTALASRGLPDADPARVGVERVPAGDTVAA